MDDKSVKDIILKNVVTYFNMIFLLLTVLVIAALPALYKGAVRKKTPANRMTDALNI